MVRGFLFFFYIYSELDLSSQNCLSGYLLHTLFINFFIAYNKETKKISMGFLLLDIFKGYAKCKEKNY